MNRLHITEERFSRNLCLVAKFYGFKTVGQMEKTLKKAYPNAKWYIGTSYVRGTTLLSELRKYKKF